jgi:hypothetical protein
MIKYESKNSGRTRLFIFRTLAAYSCIEKPGPPLLKWHTKGKDPILHQEKLDEVKSKVEEITNLRPTNEKLLQGIRTLGVMPRLKDHVRCLLTGRIKCGSYWSNIRNSEERAFCSLCKKKNDIQVLESEQHLWLNCENNGQRMAWIMAENVWKKITSRNWPVLTTGLIKGASVIAFENDSNKDSERLRILISMTIWAIWKSRNKNTISDQDVAQQEATETLKGLLTDLVRKSWNATRFMEGARRAIRQRYPRKLWADKRFTDLDLKTGPTVDFS